MHWERTMISERERRSIMQRLAEEVEHNKRKKIIAFGFSVALACIALMILNHFL